MTADGRCDQNVTTIRSTKEMAKMTGMTASLGVFFVHTNQWHKNDRNDKNDSRQKVVVYVTQP